MRSILNDSWFMNMLFYLSVFLSERLWSEDDSFRVAVKGDFWFSFLSSLMPSSESSIRKDSMCLTSCIDSVISYYSLRSSANDRWVIITIVDDWWSQKDRKPALKKILTILFVWKWEHNMWFLIFENFNCIKIIVICKWLHLQIQQLITLTE